MPIYIANKTLAAIEKKMSADQGAAFRVLQGKILPHIGDAYRGYDEPFRSHMGASVIGGDCARAVYLGWHWASKRSFSGRMLRLFNRGHLEEGRVLALLAMLGCRVIQQDEHGRQFRIVGAGGHFGGSGDGKALDLPDLKPGQTCLLEFKTHGEKSFVSMAGPGWDAYLEALFAGKQGFFNGKGVKESKPQHFTQMQIYMRKMGYAVTLYVAVNKNTDQIYMELVPLDGEHADMYLDLSEKLVQSDTPPARINKSRTYFKCKMCDLSGVCHDKEDLAVNCRTCVFAKPVYGDGKWYCEKWKANIPTEAQFKACNKYVQNGKLYL